MVSPRFASHAVGAPTAVWQMRTVMDPYFLFARPVVERYGFRRLGLVLHEHVLYVTQVAAPFDALLVLYGIKVSYVGTYG